MLIMSHDWVDPEAYFVEGGVTAIWSNPPTNLYDRNEVVTCTLTGVPRHSAIQVGASFYANPMGQADRTFTVTASPMSGPTVTDFVTSDTPDHSIGARGPAEDVDGSTIVLEFSVTGMLEDEQWNLVFASSEVYAPTLSLDGTLNPTLNGVDQFIVSRIGDGNYDVFAPVELETDGFLQLGVDYTAVLPTLIPSGMPNATGTISYASTWTNDPAGLFPSAVIIEVRRKPGPTEQQMWYYWDALKSEIKKLKQ